MGPGPGAGRRLSKIYYFIWGAAAFWPTTPPPTVTPPIPHQHPPQSSICPVIDDIHAHTRAQPTLKHTQMHVQYCPPVTHTHPFDSAQTFFVEVGRRPASLILAICPCLLVYYMFCLSFLPSLFHRLPSAVMCLPGCRQVLRPPVCFFKLLF